MPKKKPKNILQPKPIMYIYCEGEKTEPNYLTGYLNKKCRIEKYRGSHILKVIKIAPTKKNTPKQLVDQAIAAKNKSLEGDEFWVVYDRESRQKYSDKLHHDAYGKAVSKGVKIALSNVCFEVWLLLHFQKQVKPYENYEDLYNNSPLREEFRNRSLHNYDKSSNDIFNIVKDNVEQARDNAKRLNQQTESSADSSQTKPYQWNPYTDVYKLLDAIDEFADLHLSRS